MRQPARPRETVAGQIGDGGVQVAGAVPYGRAGYNIDVAFIGVDGVDATAGCTNYDPVGCRVKAVLREQARVSVVLADAAKIGRVALTQVCAVSDVDVSVTDAGPTARRSTPSGPRAARSSPSERPAVEPSAFRRRRWTVIQRSCEKTSQAPTRQVSDPLLSTVRFLTVAWH
ncbi:hypothetical protein [Actinoplanes sp. NPDC049316]|uniref:hypothetical protein n=1 Tax=Actinoplanes sp. NPDC049316 TaxID=3154727 RepID=UPI00342AE2CF